MSLQLPANGKLEGHSLLPQLKDAKAPRKWPAITTHNHDNHGIRTENWRYIRYADGSEELYDMVKDPNEWTNLAGSAEFDEKKRDLAKWLPKVNLKPAPRSAHRILPTTRTPAKPSGRVKRSRPMIPFRS